MENQKLKGKGGPGRGQGRKSKAEETQTQNLCIEAITKVWGSPEQGLEAILRGEDGGLKKFVFEHAFGKVPNELKVDGGISIRIERDVK